MGLECPVTCVWDPQADPPFWTGGEVPEGPPPLGATRFELYRPGFPGTQVPVGGAADVLPRSQGQTIDVFVGMVSGTSQTTILDVPLTGQYGGPSLWSFQAQGGRISDGTSTIFFDLDAEENEATFDRLVATISGNAILSPTIPLTADSPLTGQGQNHLQTTLNRALDLINGYVFDYWFFSSCIGVDVASGNPFCEQVQEMVEPVHAPGHGWSA